MQREQIQNFLKKKTISYLGGPILFTAPHSKRLFRGGPKYGQKKIRIHQRELYVGWIASQLAVLTSLDNKSQCNSFVVWGKSSLLDEKDKDPNYLLPQMLSSSHFHQSLHAWALKHQKTPILHVDIHGKLNCKNSCEIDVGIKSMEVHWKGDQLLKQFQTYFDGKLSKMFQGIKFRNHQCKFTTKPEELDGYWGDAMETMTEQAIKLGIPSFQLQIPFEVRKVLFRKPDFMKKLGEGIKKFYSKVIVPYYKYKTMPLKLSKQIAIKFEQTVMRNKDVNTAVKQIEKMEEKYSLNLNDSQI